VRIHTYINTYIHTNTHIHIYTHTQAGYCITDNEDSSEGKLETLYKGTECQCPQGIVSKQTFTTAFGQLSTTPTNPSVQYNVKVSGSFYELAISVPIGDAEGQLKCDETERRTQIQTQTETTDMKNSMMLDSESERRAVYKSSTLAADVEYALRQAKEWTAIVAGMFMYIRMYVCVYVCEYVVCVKIRSGLRLLLVHVCVYVCVYVYIYISYIYIYIYIYMSM
jgi:hypothetical protein